MITIILGRSVFNLLIIYQSFIKMKFKNKINQNKYRTGHEFLIVYLKDILLLDRKSFE